MSDGLEHSIDDYELLTVIGKGVFGKIFLVRELKSGHVYAMKVVKKKLIEKQNKLKYIFTERNVLIEVSPPLCSSTTPSSFESRPPSRARKSFILSYSIARGVNFIIYLPLKKNLQRSSKLSSI
jgi:serine/threonine protein kinase